MASNHESRLSLGASIVLYKTPLARIESLLSGLDRGGVERLYVIDNTPAGVTAAPGEAVTIEDETLFSSRFPRLELHRPGSNLGYGRAHNLVIPASTAKHKYHLICNPDISLGDDTLGALYDFMEDNPAVGLCMPKLIGSDGQTHYCCRRSPVAVDYISQLLAPGSWGRRRKDSLEMRSHDYDQTMEVACLSGCFMFFRSEILSRLGGFDDRFFLYFEDLTSRRVHEGWGRTFISRLRGWSMKDKAPTEHPGSSRRVLPLPPVAILRNGAGCRRAPTKILRSPERCAVALLACVLFIGKIRRILRSNRTFAEYCRLDYLHRLAGRRTADRSFGWCTR